MRFGPRLVPSANTPASMAEMFCGASPVRTCVNWSANPVHSCTSLRRSGAKEYDQDIKRIVKGIVDDAVEDVQLRNLEA